MTVPLGAGRKVRAIQEAFGSHQETWRGSGDCRSHLELLISHKDSGLSTRLITDCSKDNTSHSC